LCGKTWPTSGNIWISPAKSVLQLKPWRLNVWIEDLEAAISHEDLSPLRDRKCLMKDIEFNRIYKSEYGCFVDASFFAFYFANSLGVGIINYEVNILCNILLRPSRLWMMVDILWMEEILHQLVDGLSHCNPII
jgi:hypothetical protein